MKTLGNLIQKTKKIFTLLEKTKMNETKTIEGSVREFLNTLHYEECKESKKYELESNPNKDKKDNDSDKKKIYNEFSLQFELGIFLRESGFIVEFERNISFFDRHNWEKKSKRFEDDTNPEYVKKEIDLVVQNGERKVAIELKFPKNGQVPNQMFNFIKDIKFLEQLKLENLGKKNIQFDKGIFLIITKDHNFWKGNKEGKYKKFFKIFRNEKGKILNQKYRTNFLGSLNKTIKLDEEYDFVWKSIPQGKSECGGKYKYIMLEI